MVGYLVSWLIYVASVLALLWIYYASFAKFLPKPWQPVVLVLAACVLLTPWPVDNQSWLLAPAMVATLFNILSGAGMEAIKSLLPIFLVTTIVCFVMWFKNRQTDY